MFIGISMMVKEGAADPSPMPVQEPYLSNRGPMLVGISMMIKEGAAGPLAP